MHISECRRCAYPPFPKRFGDRPGSIPPPPKSLPVHLPFLDFVGAHGA
jgi:hypothetical protein